MKGALGSPHFENRRWGRSKITSGCISIKFSVTMTQVHAFLKPVFHKLLLRNTCLHQSQGQQAELLHVGMTADRAAPRRRHTAVVPGVLPIRLFISRVLQAQEQRGCLESTEGETSLAHQP